MTTPIKNNDNAAVKMAATALLLLAINDSRQSSEKEQVIED
jgi:hypothetical protein